MKLYIMRHGTTVWNEKNIIQGRSNNRLSRNGIAALQEVAKQYKDTHFDTIYASPLPRTMQSANIINQYHNLPIQKDDRLLEINQGIFTGRKKKSLTPEEAQIKALRLHSNGMETYAEVYSRMQNFFDYLKQTYCKDSILVVTHNACATMLYSIATSTPPPGVGQFNNGEIRLVEI